MSISNRVAKLEERALVVSAEILPKAERDARYAAFAHAVLPVAAMVRSVDELERHLKSREGDASDEIMIDFEERQRADQMRKVVARMLFEKARLPERDAPKAG